MEIRPVLHTDCNEIVKLSNRLFGENYLTHEYINTWLTHDNKMAYCLLNENSLIGYILFEKFQLHQLVQTFLTEQESIKNYFSECKQIAKLTYLGVTELHQEKGLGSKLFRNAVKQLPTTIDGFTSICWQKDKPNNMRKILINNGFSSFKFVENYWAQDSITNNYDCAICGNPPCKCSAEIFVTKKPFNF